MSIPTFFKNEATKQSSETNIVKENYEEDDDESLFSEEEWKSIDNFSDLNKNENDKVVSNDLTKSSYQEFIANGIKRLNSLPYPATSSSLSTPSEICRICHGDAGSSTGLGTLVAPCHCRGSVALVHMKCLERWLNESGTEECELCGYHFQTERSTNFGLFEGFRLWLVSTADIKQLTLDFIWFMMMTPLALFALYMGGITAHIIVRRGGRDIHWTIILLLFTSTLTVITYYGWVSAVAKHHAQSWYRWQRLHSSIRIINLASNPDVNTATATDQPGVSN